MHRTMTSILRDIDRAACAGVVIGLCAAVALTGCQREGCLGDEPGCVVPSPCDALAFTCEAGSVEVRTIERADDLVAGPWGLGAIGDFRLANDRVVAIIEGLDHPHYLAPSGGNLIDLAGRGRADTMPHMFQAVGVLPGDVVFYEEARILEGDGFAAVQLRGHLDGQPALRVSTRYEVRPCEPGIRVRTEILNDGADAQAWMASDGFYWGGRRNLPFVPGPGRGFHNTSFGLTDINEAFEDAPYMAAATHLDPSQTYAHITCNSRAESGIHSNVVTAVGTTRRIVLPRDYIVFERFIAVGETSSVGSATDVGFEVRRQLFDEPFVTLRGQVKVVGDPGAYLGAGLRASVLVSRGELETPDEQRVRVTHASPGADGRFAVRVPPGATYVLEVEAYGARVDEAEVAVGEDDADAGMLEIPAVGQMTIDVKVDGVTDHAQVLVRPSDDETEARVRGKMFGSFEECAPLLGHPHGGAPACNRALVHGPTTFAVPPGTYDVFANVGPFATAGRAQKIQVKPGETEEVELSLQSLPLQPAGTLSADLHVHGARSFDSSVPEVDRVRAFLAARVEVIASTEHDMVGDYAEGMATIDGARDRLALITGTETTGHILFKFLPDLPYPQVIGHWNFWPIPYEPTEAWRGAAWDELVEPGMLFTRQRDAGWRSDIGVAQLNHPIYPADFGRDLGWTSALGINLLKPLPRTFDGTAPSLFLRTPKGAAFGNADYHVQEVMNGTNNVYFQPYRAFWFYLLNEGIVRAGTANSDSHGLTDDVIGWPRNLVWTDTTVEDFDMVEFNAAVRAGRMIGTNGPVIEISTTDEDGAVHTPGVEAFAPAADARLQISVRAAPWVPVEEVRIYVNGELVRTLTEELAHPADPLGTAGLDRLRTALDLRPLLPGSGDAWLVVEAGRRLEPNVDFDCDGVPDTGDNNRDGTIDWRDVSDRTEAPDEACFAGGPLTEPQAPDDRDSREYLYWSLVADSYPVAFTNPLIFDRDGGGYQGVR